MESGYYSLGYYFDKPYTWLGVCLGPNKPQHHDNHIYGEKTGPIWYHGAIIAWIIDCIHRVVWDYILSSMT